MRRAIRPGEQSLKCNRLAILVAGSWYDAREKIINKTSTVNLSLLSFHMSSLCTNFLIDATNIFDVHLNSSQKNFLPLFLTPSMNLLRCVCLSSSPTPKWADWNGANVLEENSGDHISLRHSSLSVRWTRHTGESPRGPLSFSLSVRHFGSRLI